jgi:branched-chain amino acid transport system permease protein
MDVNTLADALITAVILGSLWGLLGTGFGLILGVTGRFNFAYATTFVWAIYLAIWLQRDGLPLVVDILVGVLAAVVMGVLVEVLLFRPLVNASPDTALLAVFVSSLGVVILGQAVIQLLWGSNTKVLSPGFTLTRISVTHDIGFTNLDVISVAACLVILALVAVVLRWTQLGQAILAVRENPDMSLAVGVNPKLVYVVVFAIGSALSAAGGILLTLRSAASPDAGLQPTFTALVVMFLAGLSSGPGRFLIAGLGIAVVQSVIGIWLSPLWTPALTFGILFVFIASLPYTSGSAPRLRRPLRPKLATPTEA